MTSLAVADAPRKKRGSRRPCKQAIVFQCGATLSPDDINRLASSGENFSVWLVRMRNQGFDLTVEEIMRVADAIRDNWRRYWSVSAAKLEFDR